jgi:hypothetical protein
VRARLGGGKSFVSDIFHEVDEEVRREQLKKLWDRYGNYVVAAVVLLIAAIGAWRGYEWWEAKKAAETGAAFEAASSLAEAGKRGEAEAAFAKISADGAVGPVLQDLAALRAGALLIDAGAFDEARRRLEPLTAEDRTFRHTAREFMVLAAWHAGDSAAAKRWFDMITTDAQTPAATRSRVEMLMALGAAASKS